MRTNILMAFIALILLVVSLLVIPIVLSWGLTNGGIPLWAYIISLFSFVYITGFMLLLWAGVANSDKIIEQTKLKKESNDDDKDKYF